MIGVNWRGLYHAQDLISHGKVNHGKFDWTREDSQRVLGSEGTDVDEHAKHHLGQDDELPFNSVKRDRYPVCKNGEIYSQALHQARNAAHNSGHESVRDCASQLLGQIKSKMMPEQMSISQIPGVERRKLAFEDAEIRVKKTQSGGRIISGYAAKFDTLSQDLGGFVEKIDQKAFDEVLKHADVRGLKNHDPNYLLGRNKSGTMRLAPDKVGLYFEIDAPDTQVGRDTVTEIERGDMDGCSFSFVAEDGKDDAWDDSTDPPTRTLRNFRDVYDVGPVVYPAYLATEVNARSLRRAVAIRSGKSPHPAISGNPAAYQRHIIGLKLSLGLPLTSERIGNGHRNSR